MSDQGDEQNGRFSGRSGSAQARGDFGSLSEKRKLVLATFDLCAICGHPFQPEELRWQVDLGGRPLDRPSGFNEPPVHEACVLYAAQVCPFVSSPYARLGDPARRGTRRPARIVLAGYEQTQNVHVQRSDLQPDDHILIFTMNGLRRTFEVTDARSARARYAEALAAEPRIETDPDTHTLRELFLMGPTRHGEDPDAVMAAAALAVGAAFLPAIQRVQGLDFIDKVHASLAIALLESPEAVLAHASRNEFVDEYLSAGVRWLASRQRLPASLASWRESGALRVRTRTSSSQSMERVFQDPAETGSSMTAPDRGRAKARRKQQRVWRGRHRH